MSIIMLRAGMSACGSSGTVLVLLLFPGVGSVVELLTVAVLERVPGVAVAGALIVRVMGVAAPTARTISPTTDRRR